MISCALKGTPIEVVASIIFCIKTVICVYCCHAAVKTKTILYQAENKVWKYEHVYGDCLTFEASSGH